MATRTTQLRKLMQQAKAEKKTTGTITDKLAQYTAAGELLCKICKVVIGTDVDWSEHIASQKHIETFESLKTKAQQIKKQQEAAAAMPPPPPPASRVKGPEAPPSTGLSSSTVTEIVRPLKRKAEEMSPAEPIHAPASSSASSSSSTATTTTTTATSSALPADFFDSTPMDTSSSSSSSSSSLASPAAVSVPAAEETRVAQPIQKEEVEKEEEAEEERAVPVVAAAPAGALPMGFFDQLPASSSSSARALPTVPQRDLTRELADFEQTMAETEDAIRQRNMDKRFELERMRKEAEEKQENDLKSRVDLLRAKREEFKKKMEASKSVKKQKKSSDVSDVVKGVSGVPTSLPESLFDWRAKGFGGGR